MHKPCWNDHLLEIWNSVCEMEGRWKEAKDGMGQRLKAEMRLAQKRFDRELQDTKRHFWKSVQEELL